MILASASHLWTQLSHSLLVIFKILHTFIQSSWSTTPTDGQSYHASTNCYVSLNWMCNFLYIFYSAGHSGRDKLPWSSSLLSSSLTHHFPSHALCYSPPWQHVIHARGHWRWMGSRKTGESHWQFWGMIISSAQSFHLIHSVCCQKHSLNYGSVPL